MFYRCILYLFEDVRSSLGAWACSHLQFLFLQNPALDAWQFLLISSNILYFLAYPMFSSFSFTAWTKKKLSCKTEFFEDVEHLTINVLRKSIKTKSAGTLASTFKVIIMQISTKQTLFLAQRNHFISKCFIVNVVKKPSTNPVLGRIKKW